MQRSTYVRPIGLFPAPADADRATPGAVCRSPARPLRFTAVEVCRARGRARQTAASSRWATPSSATGAAGRWHAVARPRGDHRARAPASPASSLDRPRIMGIVNVTPDSFSDGGLHASTPGGHRARPAARRGRRRHPRHRRRVRRGPAPIPSRSSEELRRVIPVIEGLRARTDALISIDTRKAEVMRRAAAAGADILNDVSALTHDAERAARRRRERAAGHPHACAGRSADHERQSAVLRRRARRVRLSRRQRIAACEAAGIPRAQARRRSRASASASTCTTTSPCWRHCRSTTRSACRCCSAPRARSFIDHISDVPDPRDRAAGLHRRRARRRRAGRADHPRARRRRHPAGAQRLAGRAARHRQGARLICLGNCREVPVF